MPNMRIALLWTVKEFAKRFVVLCVALSLILTIAQITEHKLLISLKIAARALPVASCGAAVWTLFSWRHQRGDIVLANSGCPPAFIWWILMIVGGLPFSIRAHSVNDEPRIGWSDDQLTIHNGTDRTEYRWEGETVVRTHRADTARTSHFPKPKIHLTGPKIPTWCADLFRGLTLGGLLWWINSAIRPHGPLRTLTATGICITVAEFFPAMAIA